jgi:ribose transport system substrate-binding protein
MSAQWMVEKLGGNGNIVMLPGMLGMAGVSVAETRITAAKQVFPD